jgi:hypothetical protein
MQRLGDTDALAEAMIARREFRAWSARAPAAAYVAAPAVILAGVTAAWVVALVTACNWLRVGAAPELAFLIMPLVDGVAWFSNTTLAVLLGWALVANAIRQRAPALWPMVGLIGLAALGAALQVEVTLPLAGAPGEIELRPGFGGGYWGRLALDLAVTTIPYALFSLWSAAQASGSQSRPL